MKSYIAKPKSIRKNNILSKEHSLSSFSYKTIRSKNKNIFTLGDKNILVKNIKGFEPGSKEYIDFSDNYFIRISEMKDQNFTFGITDKTKRVCPVTSSNKTKFIKKGDICYQTASNVGNVCIYNGLLAHYNSHIRKLEFKKDKYYIFAILKSSFGKEQVDVSGSIKGVDNFKDEYLLNTKIPFPTKNNHSEPQKVEQLVSLITQNIIDKEEQIKAKNQKIDELIAKELKENQKTNSDFKYSYPRISEIKKESRLDTGIYEKDFKEIDSLIRNYKGSVFFIEEDNFKSGSTPKERILGKNKNYNYLWMTPTNISNYGAYDDFERIHCDRNNLNKDAVLIINRTSKGGKGEYVGISAFYDFDRFKKGQHNQGIYRVSNYSKNTLLFLTCFMNCKIIRKYCAGLSIGSKMKEIKSDQFLKLPIPNFLDKKQQEIVKEYYNKIDKNQNLTLENYLDREKERNTQLGIFQLNMEIFDLKEKLEDIVDKIINDEKIDIKL